MTTTCNRCGKECRSGVGSQDARIMRRAAKGTCAECTVVPILQQLENMYGPDTFPDMPNCLRLPHVRKQFGNVLRAGKSDATLEDIDRERVIEVWNITPAASGTLF